MLFLYLLLCRGKAIAPDITPPARLRRWAAALFGIMALVHVWWILFYTYSGDTSSVIYGLLVALDCMALPPVFVGTLLTMLQDRRRPLWPIFVVMTPCAVISVLQIALPSIDLTTPNKIYGLVLAMAFIIYMVVAVRQYGQWLRDNYADLEHKEVWLSLTLLICLMLLLMSYFFSSFFVFLCYLLIRFLYILRAVDNIDTRSQCFELVGIVLASEQEVTLYGIYLVVAVLVYVQILDARYILVVRKDDGRSE